MKTEPLHIEDPDNIILPERRIERAVVGKTGCHVTAMSRPPVRIDDWWSLSLPIAGEINNLSIDEVEKIVNSRLPIKAGAVVWVREPFCITYRTPKTITVYYPATKTYRRVGHPGDDTCRGRGPYGAELMPRWASRLAVRISSGRCCRGDVLTPDERKAWLDTRPSADKKARVGEAWLWSYRYEIMEFDRGKSRGTLSNKKGPRLRTGLEADGRRESPTFVAHESAPRNSESTTSPDGEQGKTGQS